VIWRFSVDRFAGPLAISVMMTFDAGCGYRSSSAAGGDAATRPTFSRDVAPILFRECAPCHRPGGAGPFSVLTYREIKQHARTIATATSSRFMPPWLPVAGYGDFAGRRYLTDQEIDTIRRWEAGGAVEGDQNQLPPLPHFGDGWRLGEPDLVLRLPKAFTLGASSTEVWRNFVLPVPPGATHFVKTVEFTRGTRESFITR
jgi:hypothetical protein